LQKKNICIKNAQKYPPKWRRKARAKSFTTLRTERISKWIEWS
jgi:hypothetical protein